MEIFIWDQRYLTGEPVVDREHKGLVDLINRIVGLQAANAGPDQYRVVIDELVSYTRVHFGHEEALMADVGCDPRFIAVHKGVHQDFAQQVGKMLGPESAPTEAEFLLRFLSSWLAYHILGMDHSMARQIRKIREGGSAFAAWEDERRLQADPATSSLLTAMRSLYSVVVQRNEALCALNDQLDLQVQTRTAELASANRLLQEDIQRREAAERALQGRNQELLDLNRKLADMNVQLVQTEKLATVGRFAAGVAHEINNPLSFVHSNLGTVGGYLADLASLLDAWETNAVMPEAVRQCYGKVDSKYICEDAPVLIQESRDGLARVKKIVQDLRDFAVVDRARDLGWSNLNQCVETTLRLFSTTLPGNVDIYTELGPVPDILCSASQLNQVLSSLLNNAVEAMPEGGTIRLNSGVDADTVWLEVVDTGCGITAEALPKIFDPFYTTKPVGAGTGLGLSMAYGIVRQHGGTIEASNVTGQGACIRICLPVSASA